MLQRGTRWSAPTASAGLPRTKDKIIARYAREKTGWAYRAADDITPPVGVKHMSCTSSRAERSKVMRHLPAQQRRFLAWQVLYLGGAPDRIRTCALRLRGVNYKTNLYQGIAHGADECLLYSAIGTRLG